MDTLINMVDYIPIETMEKDLQETIQLLAIFQLADWKGVKVLVGAQNVSNALDKTFRYQ